MYLWYLVCETLLYLVNIANQALKFETSVILMCLSKAGDLIRMAHDLNNKHNKGIFSLSAIDINTKSDD